MTENFNRTTSLRSILLFIAALLVSGRAFAWPWSFDGDWKVEKTKLTYSVTHPLHDCEGEAQAVAGQTVKCIDNSCSFDFYVNVADFVSRDPKKDAEMREVTKAVDFPKARIMGSARILESKLKVIPALEIAGLKHELNETEFEMKSEWGKVTIRGDLEFSLDQFKIRRPKLIEIPIGDKASVDIQMTLVKK